MFTANPFRYHLAVGTPPYILHAAESPRTGLQTEFFHLGGTKNDVHQPLPNDKAWHVHLTGAEGGNFNIVYDTKKMHKNGVTFKVQGDGASGVEIKDDGNGKLNVTVGAAANGKNFEIIVSPK